MEDIREDDHILDIGANIGAFCIRAAKKSSHVSAVEPFTTDILNTNITLNGVDIKVFCGAWRWFPHLRRMGWDLFQGFLVQII